MKKETCYITKKEFDLNNLIQGFSLRPQIMALIKKDFPDFTTDKYITLESLNDYRKKYLESLISKEKKEFNLLEKQVIKSIQDHTLLPSPLESGKKEKLTLGQKMADKIASFGGSWTFIICFFSFLFIWMNLNLWVFSTRPFDKYPFVLLNLMLSSLAALQAPVIMMSQNRKEHKDRARSESDYQIDLKAELEIRLLHEKLDHVIINQNKRMLDIQKLQLEYMEEISEAIDKMKK